MRVYVSADIEGVTGIAHWDEAHRDHPAYGPFRERMNAEVAAACQGALLGGATELLVKDAHGSGRNLLGERLPRPARLIRGWSGHPFRMVQGLDGSFDALAFVGYHSPCGGAGHPLSHTLTGRFARVELNGQRLSELRLNAWTGRSVGVPLVFVSGDAEICAEADALEPGIVTVATGRRGWCANAWGVYSGVFQRIRSWSVTSASIPLKVRTTPPPTSCTPLATLR